MRRFLDPKNDFAFKRLFGVEQHKNILIKFLNDIFEGVHPHIEDVEFLKTSQDPEIAAMRQSIVDVLCKDVTGRQFIIEMQCASDSHFVNRAKAYACRAYLNQRKKRDKKDKDATFDYGDMKPVIFLAILNKTLFPNKKDYLSHHKHLDIKTFENDVDGLSFSFLELEKLNKEIHELSNDIEKWMYFFKNAPCTEPNELEEISKDSPMIKEAYTALAEYAFTPEELMEYDRYDMKQDEIETRISDAVNDAKKEEKREIAKKMLIKNTPLEMIMECTSLTEDEINALKA